MVTDPRKYDDLDYHGGAAIEAGQPPENGFTHIGLMLAWLIRHDLHDAGMWPDDHVEAVKAGDMTGSDLADDCDGQLVSDMLAPDGVAFLDARYDDYVGAWELAFPDLPPYSIEDTADAYAAVAPLIDAIHAHWIDAGRPPQRLDRPDLEALVDGVRGNRATLRAAPRLPEDMNGASVATQGDPANGRSRTADELRAAIPTDLTSPPMEIEAVSASEWGASLLNRALKRLGVRARDATVVAGMGGRGEQTLSVTIYGVPGIAGSVLVDEFATVIYRPSRKPWTPRDIEGRRVMWADRTASAPFDVAYWAHDGGVAHVAGAAADVVATIPRIAANLDR